MKKRRGWNEVLDCTSAFRNVMNAKLLLNQHKGNRTGWKNDDYNALYNRVVEEVQELKEALDRGDETEVLEEAADVANMAMMVADAFGALVVNRKRNR